MWRRQELLILPSSLRQRMYLRGRVPAVLIIAVSLLDSDLFSNIGVLSGARLASSYVLG